MHKCWYSRGGAALETQMYYLFMDESGELGYQAGSSRHFVIAVISTADSSRLTRCIKKQTAKLIRAGWPKHVEIKATTLWRSNVVEGVPGTISKDRVPALTRMLQAICSCDLRIHYAVVNKAKLSDKLKDAPYGITYNYFAGQLLCRAYKEHFAGPLMITVDQRNKETHTKLKFDGYLETRLVIDCDHRQALTIRHEESQKVRALQAADLVSWAIFRNYEHADDRFLNLLRPRLGFRDDWYSWKK